MINQYERVLAIDVGGSKIMMGAVDSNGKSGYKFNKQVNPSITSKDIIDIIDEGIIQIKKEENNYRFVSVGITIPGLADSDSGIWKYACFSGIKDFRIVEILFTRLKLPIFIENDVNACAYAEKLFGNCKREKDFLWITVSNGVGGGLIINGDIYTGAFGYAGEIGHFNVVENGNKCPCGKNGCLEAYAAGPGIVRRYYEKLNIHDKNKWQISAKRIAEIAKSGGGTAIDVYRETGFYLGKAIAYAVNLINPAKVILGGGISLDFELLISGLMNSFNQNVFTEAGHMVKIEKTGLSYDAAMLGAAAIALRGIERMEINDG